MMCMWWRRKQQPNEGGHLSPSRPAGESPTAAAVQGGHSMSPQGGRGAGSGDTSVLCSAQPPHWGGGGVGVHEGVSTALCVWGGGTYHC